MHRLSNRGPLTYYHHRGSKSGDTVLVGATDPRAREARTIDNFVKDHDSEQLSSKGIWEISGNIETININNDIYIWLQIDQNISLWMLFTTGRLGVYIIIIYTYIYINITEPGCIFGRSLLAIPGVSCWVVKKRCLVGTSPDTHPIFVPSHTICPLTYHVTKRPAMYLYVYV